MYNELIKLRDTTKNPKVKAEAELFLQQLNTAAGPIMLKKEVQQFLNKHTPASNTQ